MKILHTSDWHLGKKLENFSRLDEQKLVMDELCDIAEREDVDAVIVAGDLYDQFNPPTEAEELFYKTLKRLARDGERPVVVIAGNHDSPDRIEAPEALARECGILMLGYPGSELKPFEFSPEVRITKSAPGFVEIYFEKFGYPLRILVTPYANEYRLRSFLGVRDDDKNSSLSEVLRNNWHNLAEAHLDPNSVNVLCAHMVMVNNAKDKPEEPEDEKPILHIGGIEAQLTSIIPPDVQYVALGHLHKMQSVKGHCPVYYSGSPLSYSFSEAGQKKYALVVEAQPKEQAQVRPVEINAGKELVRKRFENADECVLWLNENPDALVELTLAFGDYIRAEERKAITGAHNGIVSIIPEIEFSENSSGPRVDITRDIGSLFEEYFTSRHGQKPPAEITLLFKEVLGAERGETK
ncbi:MAG: exonuclease subunit SbcD [Leptospirales bacterium]